MDPLGSGVRNENLLKAINFTFMDFYDIILALKTAITSLQIRAINLEW